MNYIFDSGHLLDVLWVADHLLLVDLVRLLQVVTDLLAQFLEGRQAESFLRHSYHIIEFTFQFPRFFGVS